MGKICSVEGCGKGHSSKGLCTKHYTRQNRFGSTKARNLPNARKKPVIICPVDTCEGRVFGEDIFCGKHQKRMDAHGTTDASERTLICRMTVEEKFWYHTNKTKTCWVYKSGSFYGYGALYYKAKTMPAHRYSFMLHGGDLSGKDMVIDHICNNKSCVNPAHLRKIDKRTNAARGQIQQAMREGHNPIEILEELLEEARSANS